MRDRASAQPFHLSQGEGTLHAVFLTRRRAAGRLAFTSTKIKIKHVPAQNTRKMFTSSGRLMQSFANELLNPVALHQIRNLHEPTKGKFAQGPKLMQVILLSSGTGRKPAREIKRQESSILCCSFIVHFRRAAGVRQTPSMHGELVTMLSGTPHSRNLARPLAVLW